MSLAVRANQLEIMDGTDFVFEEYERTLRELEVINRLTQGYAPTIGAVAEVARRNPNHKLRVLDVGFGHGDTLRALWHWARRTGTQIELAGVDLNPLAREMAIRATPEEMEITYSTSDVFDFELKDWDVVINAFFMHHLTDRQIVRYLDWVTSQVRLAWFVNDLHRHPLAFHFIKHATRFFSSSRLIRHDAPLSVARAFTRREWECYLMEAGVPLSSARIRWHWPFRYGVLCDARKARAAREVSHEQRPQAF